LDSFAWSSAILIAVQQPSAALVALVREIERELRERQLGAPIFIVDDGSGADGAAVFGELEGCARVHVARHALPLGKGAAIKTGINAILVAGAGTQCVVTADGDGVHAAGDIVRLLDIAQRDPQHLYLGCRTGDRSLPLHRRLGGRVTLGLTRFLTGLPISDTQTGLRAMPRDLCEIALHIPLNGLDFEIESLVTFRRARGATFRIVEFPIRVTRSDDRDVFNPLLDSMRIYFVFLRYCAGSLLTFATDYVIFVAVYAHTMSIGYGIASARTGSTLVSFVFNRQAVFHAHGRVPAAFIRFVMLVAGFGWIAYLATSYLSRATGVPVVYAKLLIEGLLFFAGFALNNIFVFDRPARESAPGLSDTLPGEPE
jgi:putative flippase GtrA